MATAIFARYENSVDNSDDPNDDVFSSVATNPPVCVTPPGLPNTPRTKKKPALPSFPKDTVNSSPCNRYQSCNGDVQVNGQHDTVGCDDKIVVDQFEVLQQTLKACRESLDRIDRFRNQPDRKRRLAYAAQTFGLTTKASPLVTSSHSTSDVIATKNRCAVDCADTCSPVASGTDTCSTDGHKAATLPWSAPSANSSSPPRPLTSPSPPPTGASLSTSLPTTSTTSAESVSPATPTVSPPPHLITQSDSPTTPMNSVTPTQPFPSSLNCARPGTPLVRNAVLPFNSPSPPYAIGTARSKVPSSTNHLYTHHSSSSALPGPIPSSTPTSSPCEPDTTSSFSSTTSSTHSVPSQPLGSATCHVPPRSVSTTPPSSAHSRLHNDQGHFDAQKNTNSRPRPGGQGPRGRSHSDGGEAGGSWGNGESKGVMQAEVEEITVEFEEAVGMADEKNMADLVESAVDEVETAVDDGDDDEVGGTGGSSEAANIYLEVIEEDTGVPSTDGGALRKKWRKDSGNTQGRPHTWSLHDCLTFERLENAAPSWPEGDIEMISDRLADTREGEENCTRSVCQRPRTCLYRGKRTKLEREARFGGKLRVRFADDIEQESEKNEGKDMCERRNRMFATSELDEHLDWLQADALDRRMTLVEENVLYIQDSLDLLLKADDRKVDPHDVFDSVHDWRETETSTREDPSPLYYHHHYHHHHHLSRSIYVILIICMIFILCILLLLPVVAHTVVAYVPGQPVF